MTDETTRSSRQSGEHPRAVQPSATRGCATTALLALALAGLFAVVLASAWVALQGAP